MSLYCMTLSPFYLKSLIPHLPALSPFLTHKLSFSALPPLLRFLYSLLLAQGLFYYSYHFYSFKKQAFVFSLFNLRSFFLFFFIHVCIACASSCGCLFLSDSCLSRLLFLFLSSFLLVLVGRSNRKH